MRNRRKRAIFLDLLNLEARENPAIPMGLTNFSSLLGTSLPPTGYAETHSITRSESNTVTVDQAGSGSAGTFTVTVDATSQSTDTASGSLTGSNAIDASGNASVQSTSHAVTTGSYANGAFTITGETYSETGSYSSVRDATAIATYELSTTTDVSDATRSGSYTLAWTAAESNGQLAYTSYAYTTTDTAHWFTSSDVSDGAYYESTSDATNVIDTSGSGMYASYTGSSSWLSHQYSRLPNPNGAPIESTYDNSWTNPISGTTFFMMGFDSPSDWSWKAGTADATSFSFHGVATQAGTLAESATSRATSSGLEFDVNSFTSTSHTSDSGHTIDDEPGISDSGTGTTLFHRNEEYANTDDVTGSGSYVAGAADATYHAVEVGSFVVANVSTVNDDDTSGYDEDGTPFDRTSNSSQNSTGSNISTNTHDYLDTGSGLALTGASFVESSSSTIHVRNWGTLNGIAFDESAVYADSGSTSVILPGHSLPSVNLEGMQDAFPFRGMTNSNPTFIYQFPSQFSTEPVRSVPATIRNWSHSKIR